MPKVKILRSATCSMPAYAYKCVCIPQVFYAPSQNGGVAAIAFCVFYPSLARCRVLYLTSHLQG